MNFLIFLMKRAAIIIALFFIQSSALLATGFPEDQVILRFPDKKIHTQYSILCPEDTECFFSPYKNGTISPNGYSEVYGSSVPVISLLHHLWEDFKPLYRILSGIIPQSEVKLTSVHRILIDYFNYSDYFSTFDFEYVGEARDLWTSLSLGDQLPFNGDARYRVKVMNDQGAPTSGWYYPTIITPGLLFLHVSTAQFAFGAIDCQDKYHWHYRKQGDSVNRPAGYENTNFDVAEIQILEPYLNFSNEMVREFELGI